MRSCKEGRGLRLTNQENTKEKRNIIYRAWSTLKYFKKMLLSDLLQNKIDSAAASLSKDRTVSFLVHPRLFPKFLNPPNRYQTVTFFSPTKINSKQVWRVA
eukprot:g75004.t1